MPELMQGCVVLGNSRADTANHLCIVVFLVRTCLCTWYSVCVSVPLNHINTQIDMEQYSSESKYNTYAVLFT